MKRGVRWAVMVLSVVLGLGIAGLNLRAQQAMSSALEMQKAWFIIGYRFAEAEKPSKICALLRMLPGTPSPTIVELIRKCEKGDAVNKKDVRGLVLAHAMTEGGCLGPSAFRFGEWVYSLEDVWLQLMVGALLKSPEMFMSNLEKMLILLHQVQEFLDTLSRDAPEPVRLALEEIVVLRGQHSLTSLVLMGVTKTTPEGLASHYANLVEKVSDLVDAIKKAYGVD